MVSTCGMLSSTYIWQGCGLVLFLEGVFMFFTIIFYFAFNHRFILKKYTSDDCILASR